MCVEPFSTKRNIYVMKTWNQIVKARMSELGVTQEKLAERLGITQGGLGHWLNGRREPSLDMINRILVELEIPPLVVKVAEHSNVSSTAQPHRDARLYPLISWVAAGTWAEAGDQLHPQAAELLESIENAGPHGYWLKVEGESMTSVTGFSFPPGVTILVQPEGWDLVSGKFYVAKLLATGETTFKQYVRDAGIEYLRPLNPAFRTMEITDGVQIIGRVIDAKAPRSVF